MATRATQRLFVAVTPPRTLAEELSAWARAQRGDGRGIRVLAPETIHLTLAFLGEQPTSSIDAIADAMAESARAERVEALSIGDPILLPPRRPRVLGVAVVDRDETLAGIRARLERELERAIGWSDQRKFRPHLTLARLARDARIPRKLSAPPSGEIIARKLTLFRSQLEPAGARYEAVTDVQLN